MKKHLPLPSVLFILIAIIPLSLAAQAPAISKWSVSQPFSNRVFIENKGQFNEKIPEGEKIICGVENGNMRIYFTAQGMYYVLEKYKLRIENSLTQEWLKEKVEEDFHKDGKITPTDYSDLFKNQTSVIHIQFGNFTNTGVQLSKVCTDYYTYSNGDKESYVCQAYKKLTYKNVYPNIDIEYYFDENQKEEGLKYNLILHAGADPEKIKLIYSGHKELSIDKKGNLQIFSSGGNLTDSAPKAFYKKDASKGIPATYTITNNSIGFSLGNYDSSQDIIIDPWVTSPAFTTVNNGYGIRVDYYGNCFVYGGGTKIGFLNYTYQVKKFNPAGNLIWTYTTPELSMGFYGDIEITRYGSVFISAGFGFQGGTNPMVLKLNPNGTLSANMATYTPPGGPSFEVWRLSTNKRTNSKTLFLGGGGPPANQLGTVDTSLSGIKTFDTHATTKQLKDIVYMAQEDNESAIYSTVSKNTSSPQDPEDLRMVRSPIPTMSPYSWKAVDPSNNIMEVGNPKYFPAANMSNGLNGMVVGSKYVYTYNGNDIIAWNKGNGNKDHQTNVPNGGFGNFSGIDKDHCNRVYVGVNGVIRRYSSDLSTNTTINTQGDVYDLQLNPLNDRQIYVTGKNFVQLVEFPICTTCINATSTDISGCNWGTATVTVNDPSAQAPFTYSWNTVPAQSTQNISNLQAGTYIVTVQDNTPECPLMWIDTVKISGTYVPCGPTVIVNEGTICEGSCITLQPTVKDASGAVTYNWQPGNLTTEKPDVCPTSTTTYTLNITDANGDKATDTATVYVTPKPQLTVNNPVICLGETANITVTGASSYTWSAGVSPGTTTGTASVQPASTTTYTVSGSTNGCSDTVQFTVTVNPKPQITVNSITICAGTSGTLVASGASSYSWSAGTSPASGATVSVNPTTTTSYTVTGTDNGCSGTAIATVTVSNNLNIQVPAISICLGEKDTLTASGADNYTWSSGATPLGSNQALVNPSSTSTYTVNGTSGNCSGTATVTVTVNPVPVLSANSVSVCPGDTARISISGANQYAWPATFIATGTNTAYTIGTKPTEYIISGTDLNGCKDTVKVMITILPVPEADFTFANASCAPVTINFTDQSSATIASWYWEFGDGTSANLSNPAHLYTNAGVYTVSLIVKNQDGCKDTVVKASCLHILPKPQAILAVSNLEVSEYNPVVQYTNNSTGADNCVLLFDDGEKWNNCAFYLKEKAFFNVGKHCATLIVSNNNNKCIDSTKLCTEVKSEFTFYIPNSFSPEGDGLNDKFNGFGTNILDYQLHIYNRWGEKIFTSTDLHAGWDGTSQTSISTHKLVQEGVYIYRFYITDIYRRSHEYTGKVSLIR